MPDFAARLTNCLLPQKTPLSISVDGFAIELKQDPRLPVSRNDLRGQSGHTTDVLIKNVVQGNSEKLRNVLELVVELLSFATESRVAKYYEEYPAGSGLFSQRATVGSMQAWRPPFDTNGEIKAMIEKSYVRYAQLRDPRQLHVVIDYIHHSVFQGLAQEVKIALACVAFECLRDNWARCDGYPHIDGFFRNKSATAAAPGATVGIKRHLKEMFLQVGITQATAELEAERIVDIRNEVLHTGLYKNVQNDVDYEFLETTLRTYFLRLVGFTGQYYAYVGGTSAPLTI